jgi:hypothetical protein
MGLPPVHTEQAQTEAHAISIRLLQVPSFCASCMPHVPCRICLPCGLIIGLKTLLLLLSICRVGQLPIFHG